MTDLEAKMLERVVSHQVKRLRASGQDRYAARASFADTINSSTTLINTMFGTHALGARTVERSRSEFIPAALELFDTYWPAEIRT
jgi:hypothetical protein